jgi:hypothetical protein
MRFCCLVILLQPYLVSSMLAFQMNSHPPIALISGLQILHEEIHLDKQSLITLPFGGGPFESIFVELLPSKDWRRLRFAQMLTRHLVGM